VIIFFDAVGDRRIWENATPEALADTHQTWLRDPATGHYLLDVFRCSRWGTITITGCGTCARN